MQLISKLIEISEDVPIIVEGARDRRALRELGIPGKIYTIHEPIDVLAEKIAVTGARRAIILTDYDRTGRALAGKLKRMLMNEGVTPDFEIRRELKHLIGLEFIEELPSLLLKMKKEKR